MQKDRTDCVPSTDIRNIYQRVHGKIITGWQKCNRQVASVYLFRVPRLIALVLRIVWSSNEHEIGSVANNIGNEIDDQPGNTSTHDSGLHNVRKLTSSIINTRNKGGEFVGSRKTRTTNKWRYIGAIKKYFAGILIVIRSARNFDFKNCRKIKATVTFSIAIMYF